MTIAIDAVLACQVRKRGKEGCITADSSIIAILVQTLALLMVTKLAWGISMISSLAICLVTRALIGKTHHPSNGISVGDWPFPCFGLFCFNLSVGFAPV